jgi:hypothetical protein
LSKKHVKIRIEKVSRSRAPSFEPGASRTAHDTALAEGTEGR